MYTRLTPVSTYTQEEPSGPDGTPGLVPLDYNHL